MKVSVHVKAMLSVQNNTEGLGNAVCFKTEDGTLVYTTIQLTSI